ncbi:MAG: hypothetical protein AAF570_02890 [Bacteroidota bacterium]
MDDAVARKKSQRNKLIKKKEGLEAEAKDIADGKKDPRSERTRNYLMRVGGIFEPAASLNGNRLLTFDNIAVTDTASNIEGSIRLPMKYGFGFSFARSNRWMVAVDASYQDWAGFEYFGQNQNLNGALGLNIGGEWIPDLLNRNFAKRVAWRLGGYYKGSFAEIKGESIPEYGITFGAGLPIGRFNPVSLAFSRINLGVGVSRRGTLNNNLLEETTFHFRVGVNLNDVWFIRRRID